MISCKAYVAKKKEELKEQDIKNTLYIFQVGDNPASNSYIKGKLKDCEEVGIRAILSKYEESITEDELIKEITKVTAFDWGAKVIIQLPLPEHLDSDRIAKATILPERDVDGFIYDNYEPCTPKGIIEWLEYNDVNLDGKDVVIIGRSKIVGKPLARMMEERNATVTLCHSHTPLYSLQEHCERADIIVVAIGKAKWFSFDLYGNTPIIIDVGINRDENGKLCGDVDREYMEEQDCYVTPVPGGVGLLTRLALLENVAK